jgi:Cof subfamily protein (haloacid dehalogenase superfamily)
MEKTLFVSDLDGTLLNCNETISERSASIIMSLIEQGILFTYATARAYSSARKATEKININLPVATYNGAIIINPQNNTILDYCFIEKETINDIKKKLFKSSIYPIVYSLDKEGKETVSLMQTQEVDNSSLWNFISSRNSEVNFQRAYSIEELLNGDIFYLASIGNKKNAQYMDNFFKSIDGLAFCMQEDVYKKDLHWFEVFSKEASKEKSIEKLRKYAKADKVVCFGDNINDIPMFQASDYSVAMENAYPKLKKMANDITSTNNNDGVAEWLLHNINKFHFV